MCAAGKAAAVVPASQRAPQRRRNRPRPPAHAQRPPVPLHDPHHRRIAAKPARRLRGKCRSVRQLTPARPRLPTRASPHRRGPRSRARPDWRPQPGRPRQHPRRRPCQGDHLWRAPPAHRRRRAATGDATRRPPLRLRAPHRVDHDRGVIGRKLPFQPQRAVLVPAPPQIPTLLGAAAPLPASPTAPSNSRARASRAARRWHDARSRAARPQSPASPALARAPCSTTAARGRTPRGQRQLLQPMSDPHLLPRCPKPERALPGKPVCARLHAPLRPSTRVVELREQRQPAARRGRDMRGQFADLSLELVE